MAFPVGSVVSGPEVEVNRTQLDRNSETCAAQNDSRLGRCHIQGVCALAGLLAFLSFCGEPSLSPFLSHVTPLRTSPHTYFQRPLGLAH